MNNEQLGFGISFAKRTSWMTSSAGACLCLSGSFRYLLKFLFRLQSAAARAHASSCFFLLVAALPRLVHRWLHPVSNFTGWQVAIFCGAWWALPSVGNARSYTV